MRRILTMAVVAVALLAFVGVILARSSSSVVVKPSEMKNGETKTFTDDGKTITIRREGDATHIKIEGAGETPSLTITKEGAGSIRIDRDGEHLKGFVIGPERRRIIIDGMPLDDLRVPQMRVFPRRNTQTWYVCPKDHTMLRVPDGKEGQTYKCPVDGTTMEKRRGHGFSFFFDDDLFESNEL